MRVCVTQTSVSCRKAFKLRLWWCPDSPPLSYPKPGTILYIQANLQI